MAGKVSRDKAPETGRLSDAVQKNFDINAAPNWNKFKDKEQVWNILDVSKRIAEKHGKLSIHAQAKFSFGKVFVMKIPCKINTIPAFF